MKLFDLIPAGVKSYAIRVFFSLRFPKVIFENDFFANPLHASKYFFGKGSVISFRTWVGYPFSIGENSCLAHDCHVSASPKAKVTIGNNSRIACFCVLLGAMGTRDKYGNIVVKEGNVIIGDNVFIGCHSIIMPGVTIGNGATIGANSVVTHDVPAGETWFGSPAIKNGFKNRHSKTTL